MSSTNFSMSTAVAGRNSQNSDRYSIDHMQRLYIYICICIYICKCVYTYAYMRERETKRETEIHIYICFLYVISVCQPIYIGVSVFLCDFVSVCVCACVRTYSI